jgi:sortase (surface protein transpeptidase)
MTRGAAKGIERCLWAIGFLALAVWIGVWLNARLHQAEGNQELERRLGERVESPGRSTAPETPKLPKLTEGDLIGRIEIPRLRMSTVVFEGTGDGVLRIGVGHLAGSPLPAEM